MKKFRGRQLLIIILIFALCFVFSGSASAADNTNPDQKAVVFLLDASGSMKTNDPQRYAIDSIAQLIFTLPSNYEIGFAAYNTEVCASQELLDNDKRGQIMALAQAVEYAGFSNAGAGLEQAVRLLLEADPGTEKSIVLLSDGEFLMSDDALTERSRAAYQEASDLAAREGITIHVIGLGEDMENTDNSVFQAASLTGGGIYYTPGALGIQAAMESILTEWFQIKQTTAAMIDADGGDEVIPVELPFSYASVVRVLLTSDSPIKNVKTSFQGESANQVTGERYSLIEIVHPQSGRMEVSFVGTAGSQVRIALIPEYKAVPQISVSYEDQEPLDATAVRYDRTAVLEYSFYDGDNEHIQIWTEELATPISNGGLHFTPPGIITGSARGGISQYHYFWLPSYVGLATFFRPLVYHSLLVPECICVLSLHSHFPLLKRNILLPKNVYPHTYFDTLGACQTTSVYFYLLGMT